MTPCRVRNGPDRLALVTATNSGSSVPERDDAAQPDSARSSSTQAATQKPATTQAAQPKVAFSKPPLGAPIDRIMLPQMYGGDAWPRHQYVDDLEIWNWFPDNATNPH